MNIRVYKRPLNETLRKCCQKRLKASPDVLDCRLNKHRLINSLEGLIDETGLRHENTQIGLPLEISPKVPESALDCRALFGSASRPVRDPDHIHSPPLVTQAFREELRDVPGLACGAGAGLVPFFPRAWGG